MTSNTTVFLIRHGDVDNPENIIYGRRPLSITQKGIDQMKALARELKNQGVTPDVIYTSPIKRALQSAQAMGEIFSETPIIEALNLQEVDCSPIVGRSLEWIHSIRDDAYYHPQTKNLPVERPETIIDRVTQEINKIVRKHEGKTIFIVSHGDPLAFAFWRLLNPEKQPTSYEDLKTETMLEKGTALKLTFSEDRRMVEHEFFVPNESQINGEKEN